MQSVFYHDSSFVEKLRHRLMKRHFASLVAVRLASSTGIQADARIVAEGEY